MENITIKQGFRGELQYTLNYEGKDIDVSGASVRFNFVDGHEKNRQSILCRQGDAPNEVIIPFKNESALPGDFYGEFVIKDGSTVLIYPIKWYVNLKITKSV